MEYLVAQQVFNSNLQSRRIIETLCILESLLFTNNLLRLFMAH